MVEEERQQEEMQEREQVHYSIGEVGDLVDLEPHVLRYWESKFDVLQPQRDQDGHRVYTEDDVVTVRRIQHLLKEEKYTIEGARQVFEREKERAARKRERNEDLARYRASLMNLFEKL